ncbi:MAG: class III extradiol ring-cleavage dioxygenase [Pseudomonadota bacterium]
MTTAPTSDLAGTAIPAIFLAHGSPVLLDDAGWVAELGAWARALPRPRAILMLSAHWVDHPVTIAATRTVPLIYDFYGFPEKYYRVTYPAPGAPALAARVRALLAGQSIAEAPDRGLDHGAYIPLVCMYPDADVPVLQVSLPSMDPAELLALGRTLAPLRREGVLIVGSGFLTHNLRGLDLRPGATPAAWAVEFDAWAADVLARRDVDALLDYRRRAPGVRQALPTHEHFVPVIAALGAAIDDPSAQATFPISGFTYGSMTRRSLQLG